MGSHIDTQMRIQTEYMSLNNCWTRSSSNDFQAHQQSYLRRCCFSQTAILWFEVLPDMLPADPGLSPVHPGLSPVYPGLSLVRPVLWPALPGAPSLVVRASRVVVRTPIYFEGRQECPPIVWYSPELDASKFTLHIFSDTPGGFQWLKYILLMDNCKPRLLASKIVFNSVCKRPKSRTKI
jgi:hypothetical protein